MRSGHEYRLIPLFFGLASVLFMGLGCTGTDGFISGYDFGPTYSEAGHLIPDQWFSGPCTPGGDLDKDGIPNEVEGCGKDTDGDQLPDYNDTDSDNDKIPDKSEVGADPKNPVDTDGDKTTDYKDTDSDGDGIKDGD